MIMIPVESRLTEYLHSKAAWAGIPLNGTFELTPCCNMACKNQRNSDILIFQFGNNHRLHIALNLRLAGCNGTFSPNLAP